MPNYDEIIQKSQENVNALSQKLKALDKLYQDTIALPTVFDTKFEAIAKTVSDFVRLFNESTNKYVEVNNSLLTSRMSQFSEKLTTFNREIVRLSNIDLTKQFTNSQLTFIAQTRKDLKVELDKFEEKSDDLQLKIDSLNSEIERLVGTDLTNQFNDLQTAFIAQTRKDLKQELDKFEEKSDDLQAKNEALEIQVDRLTKVDLDKGFDKLQKTLSDIFGSVNSINQTLTVITQNFTGITQTLGVLQASIDTHHKETIQSLGAFSESTAQHLIAQDKEAKSNYESLESRINLLSEQNELIRKEIKTNRVIQLVGFGLTVAILVYIVVKG